MKEYAIYCRIKKGRPFIVATDTNKSYILTKLQDILLYLDSLDYTYFVDNDFYYNKYVQLNAERYYCIKVREISEWQSYTETENIQKENNKIIYFHNFIK